MNKKLFFPFLVSLFLPIFPLQAGEAPVPVQIPLEELTPDALDEPVPDLPQEKTEEKTHSILQNAPTDPDEAESLPGEAVIVEEIPATGEKSVVSQPAVEEIPLPDPRPITEEIPSANPGERQPVRTSSGLIPFNPAGAVGGTQDPEADYFVTDPANFLISVLKKHQFPYAFLQVEVLSSNVESQPLNHQFVQMNLPVMISFNTEAFAAFQAELESALELISVSFQNEVSQQTLVKGRKMIREGVTLNVPDGSGHYRSYELPKECREALAQYAALLPVGKISFYDENENVLQNLFFPLLYRDIVKAFPINLLEVYQGDHQTIRILEHQNDPFMEFIQTQGKSFVIPERFPVILAYSASAEFLERLAKTYYLEPVFRRPDPLPQIPMMFELQLPTSQFQKIRFMNCEIMTDRPGEAVSKPVGDFVIQETSPETVQKSVLTKAELKPAVKPEGKAAPEELDPTVPLEQADEELPFILEEIPTQEAN